MRSDSGCGLRFCKGISEKTQWPFQGVLTAEMSFICGSRTVAKSTQKPCMPLERQAWLSFERKAER
jgi:hypothetical protein